MALTTVLRNNVLHCDTCRRPISDVTYWLEALGQIT